MVPHIFVELRKAHRSDYFIEDVIATLIVHPALANLRISANHRTYYPFTSEFWKLEISISPVSLHVGFVQVTMSCLSCAHHSIAIGVDDLSRILCSQLRAIVQDNSGLEGNFLDERMIPTPVRRLNSLILVCLSDSILRFVVRSENEPRDREHEYFFVGLLRGISWDDQGIYSFTDVFSGQGFR